MQERKCQLTQQKFFISKSEEEAYKYFALPLPTLSPIERIRRLLSFVPSNDLYLRKCAFTGEEIFSTFPISSPVSVIASDVWFSNTWSATAYAEEYDPSTLFIEQLQKLWFSIPRPALANFNSPTALKCHQVKNVSNSERVSYSSDCEYCINCHFISSCDNCLDCYFLDSCSRCYDSVHCFSSSALRWAEFCTNCKDCWFISACDNCSNCLFCSNLLDKEYYIFNEQVSKEKFHEVVASWEFFKKHKVEVAKEAFSAFLESKPVPHIFSSELSDNSGNYLWKSERAYNSFECFKCNDIMHCSSLFDSRFCLEGLGFGFGLERACQFVSCGNKAKGLFNCVECWDDVEDLAYCSHCCQCKDLFACVGLREKEYCIFNQQYSRDEYQKLKSQIIEQLKRKNAWGKFLPLSFSDYPYNVSAANGYMPLSGIPCKMMGFRWNDSAELMQPSKMLGDRFSDIVDDWHNVNKDEIVKGVYLCEILGRAFSISEAELDCCINLGVALCARCFEQRHNERIMRSSGRSLNERQFESEGVKTNALTTFSGSFRRPVVEQKIWFSNRI